MPSLVSTTRQRLIPSSSPGYSAVEAAPGEPETLRDDLGGDPGALTPGRGEVLLRLVHLTDLHVMDAGSPARSDWVEARAHDPRWLPLLHMARPHDLLANWGAAAFSCAINEGVDQLGGGSSAVSNLVAFTGDNIDNAQQNEMEAFIALAEGGSFRMAYEGPQRTAWALDERASGPAHRMRGGLWPYWLPDGGADDRFRSEHGFPLAAGLVEATTGSVTVPGVGLPWPAAPVRPENGDQGRNSCGCCRYLHGRFSNGRVNASC